MSVPSMIFNLIPSLTSLHNIQNDSLYKIPGHNISTICQFTICLFSIHTLPELLDITAIVVNSSTYRYTCSTTWLAHYEGVMNFTSDYHNIVINIIVLLHRIAHLSSSSSITTESRFRCSSSSRTHSFTTRILIWIMRRVQRVIFLINSWSLDFSSPWRMLTELLASST